MSSLQFHSFKIPQLGQRSRQLRILLPPGYDKSGRQYPVLYALDGQNLFEASTAFGGRHWKIPERLEKMPRRLRAIVVGIDNGGTARLDEYAPYRKGRHGGEGDAFAHFLMETVKPFTDHRFRTMPGPETTGIVGSSLGGLLALYTGLKYGQVFGRVGVLSPSLWFNPQVLQLAQTPGIYRSRFYICASKTESKGMENHLRQAFWTLKNNGWTDDRLRVTLRDRGRHGEAFWAREYPKMHRFLLEY